MLLSAISAGKHIEKHCIRPLARALRYRKHIGEYEEFVRFHNLPRELARRTLAYVNFAFSISNGIDVERLSGQLPANLQLEIQLQINKKMVEQVSLFSGSPKAFFEQLVMKLNPALCVTGDYVFYEGEEADRMFFIKRGVLRVRKNNIPVSVLTDGQYFGESALLSLPHIALQQRIADVECVSDCMLLVLSRSDFEEVLEQYPQIKHRIQTGLIQSLEAQKGANRRRMSEAHGHKYDSRQNNASFVQNNASFVQNNASFTRNAPAATQDNSMKRPKDSARAVEASSDSNDNYMNKCRAYMAAGAICNRDAGGASTCNGTMNGDSPAAARRASQDKGRPALRSEDESSMHTGTAHRRISDVDLLQSYNLPTQLRRRSDTSTANMPVHVRRISDTTGCRCAVLQAQDHPSASSASSSSSNSSNSSSHPAATGTPLLASSASAEPDSNTTTMSALKHLQNREMLHTVNDYSASATVSVLTAAGPSDARRPPDARPRRFSVSGSMHDQQRETPKARPGNRDAPMTMKAPQPNMQRRPSRFENPQSLKKIEKEARRRPSVSHALQDRRPSISHAQTFHTGDNGLVPDTVDEEQSDSTPRRTPPVKVATPRDESPVHTLLKRWFAPAQTDNVQAGAILDETDGGGDTGRGRVSA